MVIARSAALVLLALLVLVFFSACASGSHRERAQADTAPSRRISGFGVSLELPTGWYGRVVKSGERDATVIQAANFQRPDEAYLGPKTANAMDEDSIHIELAGFDSESDELVGKGNWRAAELPIWIDRSHLGGPFSGIPVPAVAVRWLVIDGRAVMLFVGFGVSDPSDAMFAEANHVLATLSIDEWAPTTEPCRVMNEGVPFFPQFAEGDPVRGEAGERFEILAAGTYAPAEQVELLWEDASRGSTRLASAQIEQGCQFSLAFTVPDVEPGSYRVVIRSYDPDSIYAITSAHSFLVAAKGDSARRSAWITHYDPLRGFSLSYPPAWFPAKESLTPNLADPIELVTLATFPPDAPAVGCAQFPTGALEKLAPQDALVSLQERSGDPVGFPARNEPFRPQSGYPSEAPDCLEGPTTFVDRFIPFADAARPLYAYIALGDSASATTRDEAFAILNTLRVTQRGE